MISFEVNLFDMPCTISIGKVKMLYVENNLPIWHFKDVKITNHVEDGDGYIKNRACGVRKFVGHYFVADMGGHQYYHTLVEKFGQHLWLSKHIDNINFLPISGFYRNFSHMKEDQTTLNMLTIGSMLLKLNFNNLIFINRHTEIHIENAYMSTSYSFQPFQQITQFGVPAEKLDRDNPDTFIPLGEAFFAALHKRAMQISYSKKDFPKKIFISRKKANQSLEKHYQILERIRDHTASKEDYLLLRDGARWGSHGNIHFFWANLLIRYYPDEESDRIEKFFEGLGYTIIHAEEYDTVDQAALFNQATHIVAWRGTSCTNFYAAQPTAKQIIINNSVMYRHPYPSMSKAISNNVYEFPEIGTNIGHVTEHRFTADEIISEAIKIKNIL